MLFYTVCFYPILLILLGLFSRTRIVRDDLLRKVAMIIPVHNGEQEIESKLENCLAQKYPREYLDIYVISDGSTDNTVEIVKNYADSGVRCLLLEECLGKVAAQNKLLPMVDAEIFVFTDVGIHVSSSAVRNIVSNFADETIGAVSCRDEIVCKENCKGDSLYIRYDMIIRNFTSRVGSLIGVTGGFYGVRREIAAEGGDPAFPPDFYVALKALQMGYRVVEDDRVIARYYTPTSDKQELTRKVRTITRGMCALFANTVLLNPFRYPMVSLQLISHKLLRWLAPLFFIICLVTSAFLAFGGNLFFQVVFFVQFILIIFGSFCIIPNIQKYKICRVSPLPRLFVLFNLAILMSWKNFLTGKKIVRWKPTTRMG